MRALTPLVLLTLASHAQAATGGPDAFGYTYIDSNSPGGPVYSGTSGGSNLSVPQDGSTAVAAPFPILFYGQSYNTVNVGEDGILTFTGSSPGPANSCGAGPNQPFVAAWWDDWDQGDSDEIRTSTTGSAPNRVFIVRWAGIGFENGDGSVSFIVRFFEAATNGNTPIEVHYSDVQGDGGNPGNGGGSGTVAIGAPGGGFLEYHCNSTGLTNNLAVRFEVTCLDNDNDGAWDCEGDCDDNDATIYPGAAETCSDGIDQDCSGADLLPDEDGDTFIATACGGDDCDDASAGVHPGVYDICDLIDQDCDGVINDDDQDGDGSTVCADCDDFDFSVLPGAVEVCSDGIDQDCSGADLPLDGDGDTYIALACGGNDCDDSAGGVHPGAYDVCDLADQNCDGFINNGDQDGDGSSVCVDCNDFDSTVLPGGAETCSDGIDQDCSGADLLPDEDGDTYVATTCGGNDCAPTDANIHPFAWDDCDLIDDDCTGVADDGDADGDGVLACLDCADHNASVHPGAMEVCADGIDQDCSGADDVADADGDGIAPPSCGGNDCDDLDAAIAPGQPELCDGLDNDCDGSIDETDSDGDGSPDCQDCAPNDAAVGPSAEEICANGIDDDCDGFTDNRDFDGDGAISSACGGADCDDTNTAVGPGHTEVCDGLDNDCNGVFDAGDGVDADGDTSPDCIDCAPADPNVWPGAAEDCSNGIDDDCDSLVDTADETCPPGDDDTAPGNDDSAPGDDDSAPGNDDSAPGDDDSAPGDDDSAPGDDDSVRGDDDTEPGDDDTGSISDDDTTPAPDQILSGDGCDCNSTGAGSPSALVLAFALMRRRQRSSTRKTLWSSTHMRALTTLALLTLASHAQAATGGPDAFGYTYIDSNSPGGPVYSGTFGGSDLFVPQDGSTAVAAPFPILFYGQSYNTVNVGEDGILTFTGTSPGPANSCGAGPSQPFVAAWWDDWDQDESEQIRTATSGSAPNRVFIVRWVGIDFENGDGSVSFLVRFFEAATNGNTPIEVHYSDVQGDGGNPGNGGGSGTVAIGAPGGGFLEYHCNSSGLNNNLAVRFEVTCLDNDNDGAWDCEGDCDDNDATIFPGAVDICLDGIDQDCSGTDQGTDDDGDTFVAAACGGNDCDDASASVHPGAYDLCDSVDENCDTFVDNGDQDGDGSTVCVDCDDLSATTNPGATETCSDGIDQDCSGADLLPDEDGDTFVAVACGGNDCGPLDASIHPFVWDDCDLVDDDCNGVVDDGDEDGDGVLACLDCADLNAAVHPGAIELCADGIDQDCSGADAVADFDGDGIAPPPCGGNDCDDLDADVAPGLPELCDGADNDCDGGIDEGDTDGDGSADCEDCAPADGTISPLAEESCGNGTDDDCDGFTDNRDIDADGAVSSECGGADCDDENDQVGPGRTEICDGFDNNCDGELDPGDSVDADGDASPDCLDCAPSDANIHPDAVEDCANTIDDDCDSLVDAADEDCTPGDDDDDSVPGDDDDSVPGDDDDSANIGDDDTTPPPEEILGGDDGCDCQTAGGGASPLLLSVLLLIRRRRT